MIPDRVGGIIRNETGLDKRVPPVEAIGWLGGGWLQRDASCGGDIGEGCTGLGLLFIMKLIVGKRSWRSEGTER
jgi:hypothetical protein